MAKPGAGNSAGFFAGWRQAIVAIAYGELPLARSVWVNIMQYIFLIKISAIAN
jgi:hypothetical protein